ncbi:hypothetical protein [Halorussus marinus]|uniref:hypothetical protein n=1 Tax=Halorussus marinus TaxID=2505976 RepID=UPI0010921DC1|nr:hypothetical protein [Halorussus marinus]
MADEDAGRPREDDEGLSLSLPPISLPAVRLPDRIRLVFPVPDPPEPIARPRRVRTSWVFVAVALADALDAAAVLVGGPTALPWVRATAGTVLSILFAGLPGLLYSWELFAALGGRGCLSVAPTATLLVVAGLFVGD